jgi:hypothetical protein
MTPRRGRLSLVSLVVVTALASVSLGSIAVASPSQRFAADVEPACAPADASVTFTATLRNESTDRSIGSANITAPAGFTITSIVTPPPVGTATFDATGVRLRNLRVVVGGSVSVAFRATTPGAGVYSWHDPAKLGAGRIQAKPTRDFSGTEQFRFDLGASHVDLFVGTCALNLHFSVPPAMAEMGANVTGDPLNPSGIAVAVEVLDSPGGARVTTSTDPVSLVLVPPSGTVGAALTPATPTVEAVDGLAVFDEAEGDGFSISPSGIGYRITATSSPGIAPVTSDVFDVVDGGIVCTGAGCSTSAGSGDVDVTVTAPDAQLGDTITILFNVEELDCPGYTPLAGTPVVTFVVTGNSVRIVRIRVPAALATRPRSQDRVCYASELAFVDRDGVLTNVGVLPQCPVKNETATPPCQRRTRVVKRTGDHIISFIAPPGSTRGRT